MYIIRRHTHLDKHHNISCMHNVQLRQPQTTSWHSHSRTVYRVWIVSRFFRHYKTTNI